MRKNFKLLGAVAVAGVVATTGSAFTAGNTVNGNNVAGYGSSTVSGATTEVIEHTLSADGTTITSTSLTFTTDLGADHQVKSGFGSTALESCTVTVNVSPAKDTAVCTYAGSGYTTSAASDFRVAVS
jgi:hypothetical protein